jgi:hypothetical protein
MAYRDPAASALGREGRAIAGPGYQVGLHVNGDVNELRLLSAPPLNQSKYYEKNLGEKLFQFVSVKS